MIFMKVVTSLAEDAIKVEPILDNITCKKNDMDGL